MSTVQPRERRNEKRRQTNGYKDKPWRVIASPLNTVEKVSRWAFRLPETKQRLEQQRNKERSEFCQINSQKQLEQKIERQKESLSDGMRLRRTVHRALGWVVAS
jgi:hypothetical protein